MRPSAAVHQHRDAIYSAASRYRAANPRVFGSVLRGDDGEGSDLDLLVDALPGATLFDLGGLQDELEYLLAVHVDVVTARGPARQIPRFGTGGSQTGMNDNRLADYLDHMRQAVTDACGFIDGMDLAVFLQDKRTQQAVVMSLIVLGEAATKVMERHAAFAEAHCEIPWRNMRGMRNRIAHGYFDIDLDVVWETVQIALPELQAQLVGLVPGN